MWFENPFHSQWLLFIPLSFKEQRFLIFMKSGFSFCSFIDSAFGVTSKKFLPNLMSQGFSPVFFYKFCSFKFYTYVLFWVNFGTGARYRLRFSCISTVCWKDCLFCTESPLQLCWKSIYCPCVQHYWAPWFCLLTYMSFLFQYHTILIIAAFIVSLGDW